VRTAAYYRVAPASVSALCTQLSITAEVVERIVREREGGRSLRDIAQGLDTDGVATAQGGRSWHASTVRSVLRSATGVYGGHAEDRGKEGKERADHGGEAVARR